MLHIDLITQWINYESATTAILCYRIVLIRAIMIYVCNLTESSHIELRKVIKQAQVHCPAQMSYSNEINV